MRTTTAYLAGAGTVIAALAIGLGGGLVVSNIVSPHQPRTEMSKLELRMSARPIPATNTSSDPAPQVTAVAPASISPSPANDLASLQDGSASTAGPPQPEPAVQQAVAPEKSVRPDDVFARARDTDVRREARREQRQAEQKRRAERRQQWAERRYQSRREQMNDQELQAVEAKVRETTERPRPLFAADMPRIRLFDPE